MSEVVVDLPLSMKLQDKVDRSTHGDGIGFTRKRHKCMIFCLSRKLKDNVKE